MRIESVGKKYCSFALTSEMTHSLWWEHLILNVWCCFPSSSSSCIHPPRHIAFILLRVTSAPCAAEQRFGFYGSCCSQRTRGRGGERRKKKPKVAGFGCMAAVHPRPAGWAAFREGAPRVGRSRGQQLLGHPGPGAFAFSSSMKWLKDNSQVEGVKNSRLPVWLIFAPCFLLSCLGLQFCSKQPSASAFQTVKMQMPDLR